MKTTTAIISGIVLLSISARAQTPFQNLNFESAQVPDVLNSYVPFSQALPGWTGYFGTNLADHAVVDTVSLGAYNISILGHHAIPGFGPLDGNWSAFLQGGFDDYPFPGPLPATLAQIGFVPTGTLSLQMRVNTTSNLVVTLGGQAITMRLLDFDLRGFLYGGDVSQFAGQTAELRITVLPPHSAPTSDVELDDIIFSPQPVPEPAIRTITLLALIALITRSRAACLPKSWIIKRCSHMKTATAIVSGIILLSISARAQTPFQNLDFESAQVPDVYDSFNPYAPFSEAFPGWVGYFGTNPVSQAFVNTVSLGKYNISILGHNDSSGHGPMEGNWTAVVQAGSQFPVPGPLPTTLAQTGFVPVGTLSVQMLVRGNLPTDVNNMAVSLGGQPVTMRPLQTGFYGADISQFAGQTAELRITVLPTPGSPNATVMLDHIVFSPLAVPEPALPAITVLCLLVLNTRSRIHRSGRPRAVRASGCDSCAQGNSSSWGR